jgi:hypothetical protein
MNLQLLITRKEYTHYNSRTRTKHLFAVIDLDESKQYPQNFVSVLPLHVKATVKPSNVFEGLFGNKSLEIANQLLHKALESRPDFETARAIRERIELLATQQNNIVQCLNCGNTIKQSKKRVNHYKVCYQCHSKAKQKIDL